MTKQLLHNLETSIRLNISIFTFLHNLYRLQVVQLENSNNIYFLSEIKIDILRNILCHEKKKVMKNEGLTATHIHIPY